jgi:hypothetical protein
MSAANIAAYSPSVRIEVTHQNNSSVSSIMKRPTRRYPKCWSKNSERCAECLGEDRAFAVFIKRKDVTLSFKNNSYVKCPTLVPFRQYKIKVTQIHTPATTIFILFDIWSPNHPVILVSVGKNTENETICHCVSTDGSKKMCPIRRRRDQP